MLLFGYCLIPVVRFSDSRRLVTESSVLGFRNLFGFQVTRRSRAALVFAKCIHVLLLHFLREWHHAGHPGARCLGSLTQNMLTFLDIYNPETVWMTGAHAVKWQRPGSWEAQEIRRQRRRRVALFEVSSSCTSFLAPKFLGRKAVGLEVLVTELGRGPSPSNLRSELLERKRCLNTTLCEKYHNQFGNRGGDSRLRLRFVISAYFRYIFSSDHPLVANASSSTTLRLSPWNTCIVYYIHTIFPRSSFVLLYFPVGSNLLYTGNCNTGGSWFFSVKLESSSLKPLHSNFFRVKENIADKGVNT